MLYNVVRCFFVDKKKPIVLAIVAVVILSSTFIFFNFQYPSAQNSALKVPKLPPVNLSNLIFFSNQTIDSGGIGNLTSNISEFSFTGSVNTTIEGFLSNSLTGSVISDTSLIVALYPFEVVVRTNISGFYSFETLKGGYGNLTYKPFNFHQKLVHVDLTGRPLWENVSFTPALKYNISGFTLSSSGLLPSVTINFFSPLYTCTTTSGQNSKFGVSLYNGTYNITVFKTGFANLPEPTAIFVHGYNVTDYNLTLFLKSNFTINGTVITTMGYPVSGASVTDRNAHYIGYTNISGNFSVEAVDFSNTLYTTAVGFYPNTTSLYITHNLSDVIIRLVPIDPFPVGTKLNNTSIPGYINGTNHFPLSNSSLNYSSHGSYIIDGYIFGWKHMPVANQSFYFIIRVLGQYYAKLINSTQNGTYSLPINYLGNYDVLVESEIYNSTTVKFSATLSNSRPVNISMTTLSRFYGNLTGSAESRFNSYPIANASLIVYGGNLTSYNEKNITDSHGKFNITFYPGTYHIVANAAGYYTNNSINVFPVSKYQHIIIYLTPDNSIGTNISEWSPSNGTGIPGLGSSNITGNLTSNGTSDGYYPFKVILKPEFSNTPLRNDLFEIFIRINGVDYHAINSTNWSGESVISLNYAGNYQIIMELEYYFSKDVNFSVPANSSVLIPVFQKATYQMKINAFNFFNETHNLGNNSVPIDFMNFTNDIFSSNFTVLISNYGTNYTENLPAGNYNLSYENLHFVRHNFSVNLSAPSKSISVPLKPYEIMIEYNSEMAWNFSINGGTTQTENNGNSTIPLQETSGTYTVDFYINGSKGYTNQSSFQLNSSSSYKILHFNVTQKNLTSDVMTFKIYVAGIIQLEYGINFSNMVYIFSAVVEHYNSSDIINASINNVNVTGIHFTNLGGNLTDVSFNLVSFSGSGTFSLFVTTGSGSSISIPKTIDIFYYSVTLNTT